MTEYGVTPQGFVPKQQQQIIADINAALQAAFGVNINLGAESVFGQLVGVFSEREALLWQLAEAVYDSQYPGGAEGTSVDNILALNNLTRLPATPTVTDPTPVSQTNGVVLYGLVLYGDPGTVVPAGSQVRSTTTPALTFTLDASVTIADATNAQQSIVLSNVPTSGSYRLAITDPAGNTLTTPAVSFESYAYRTQLLWGSVPTSGRMFLMIDDSVIGPIDPTWGHLGIHQALEALNRADVDAYDVSGDFSDGFVIDWSGFNPVVSAKPTLLKFSAAPTSGAYTLTIGGATTGSIAYNATAAQVQAAIAAAGFPRARVGAAVTSPANLFPGNVQTGTDLGRTTDGFFACQMDLGFNNDGNATVLASSADVTPQEGVRCLLVQCAEGYPFGAGVRVPVTPGVQYTASAYVRSVEASMSAVAGFFYAGSGGSLGSPVATNNSGWTRLSVTFTVPAGQTVVQFMVGQENANTGAFYADAFRLEVGSSASSWSSTDGVSGFGINWVGTETPPSVVVASNTLAAGGAVTLTPVSGYSLDQPVTVVQSLQALFNNLYDAATGKRPYNDVTVSEAGSVFTVDFGSMDPQPGEVSSGSMPQAVITVPSNTLQSGSAVTNVAVILNAPGAPAQGTGTATCTTDGPNAVLAGQLTVIGSPVAGWNSVTNQLDCIPGSNVETDTEALLRRSSLASSQARGPIESIVDKVSSVPGVTSAIGFSNTTAAALQVLTYDSPPVTGNYRLALGGGVTANIPYSATASTLQDAINAVPGYAATVVSGGAELGFEIDFNGAQGGQGQSLIQVVSNTTGVSILVAYGRAPKSFEIVVEGGSSKQIAKTIYGAMPPGIASYGTPAQTTLATMTQASNVLSVASASGVQIGQGILGLGVPAGATVDAIAGTSVTMSAAALGSYTDTPVVFNWSAQVTDDYGNPITVNFSRPVPVLFYVSVELVTDQYRTPGVPSSGVNPSSKFSPGSVPTIQADLAEIGNKTPIGGLVVGAGTNGLVGAFNEVPGIVDYTLTFGVTPSPSSSNNVQLLPTQIANFQRFNIAVSWT